MPPPAPAPPPLPSTGRSRWALNIRYDIAQYWRSREPGLEDGARLTRALSTRGLLDEAERAVGPYPRGYACSIEDDERRADFSEYLLEAKRPRLHLAYFAALDEVQHRSGPGSAPALRVLERMDALVGRLRAAAARASGGAVVAVVSDHGFTVTDRELDLNQALHEAGLLELDDRGHVRGWRAAAWGQGGSASIVLRDAHDTPARGRVRRLLEALARTRPSPIDRVQERDPALFPGGSPGEAFTVFLSLDTRLVDLRQGFVLRKAERAGDHGHDPRRPEMDAVFVSGRTRSARSPRSRTDRHARCCAHPRRAPPAAPAGGGGSRSAGRDARGRPRALLVPLGQVESPVVADDWLRRERSVVSVEGERPSRRGRGGHAAAGLLVGWRDVAKDAIYGPTWSAKLGRGNDGRVAAQGRADDDVAHRSAKAVARRRLTPRSRARHIAVIDSQ